MLISLYFEGSVDGWTNVESIFIKAPCDGGHYDGEEGWFGDSNLLSP